MKKNLVFLAFIIAVITVAIKFLVSLEKTQEPPVVADSPDQVAIEFSDLFDSQFIDGPIWPGDMISLDVAQARVLYSIPLPKGMEIVEVWASSTDIPTAERSIAVRFQDDLFMIVVPLSTPPDWDAAISTPSVPLSNIFQKISVNGVTGIGFKYNEMQFIAFNYVFTSSVYWWVDGISITLYSEYKSIDELLRIAEEMDF